MLRENKLCSNFFSVSFSSKANPHIYVFLTAVPKCDAAPCIYSAANETMHISQQGGSFTSCVPEQGVGELLPVCLPSAVVLIEGV